MISFPYTGGILQSKSQHYSYSGRYDGVKNGAEVESFIMSHIAPEGGYVVAHGKKRGKNSVVKYGHDNQ